MAIITGVGMVAADNCTTTQQKLGVSDSLYRFVPYVTFTEEVDGNESTYVKGMKYSIHPGNNELLDLVKTWVSIGKVKRVI